MSSNRLRLNSAKTQFIWLGTRQQLARLDMTALSDAFPLLAFSSAVRDLDVTLDCQLTFATHINLLNRDCFYQLRQLRSHSFAYSICNFHPCARLRCKQAGLLLLALRWPPCLSTGVLGSGPAFCCPPNWWHT